MNAQLSFFNTTSLTNPELAACIKQAKNQDSLVLDAFKLKNKLTPSDVWQLLIRSKRIDPNTPITSIRRSITCLTPDHLEMLTEQKKGIYNRNEHYWQLKQSA